MSRVKLIMLVALVFNMQSMRIGGIVWVILSFPCYVVGAYWKTSGVEIFNFYALCGNNLDYK